MYREFDGNAYPYIYLGLEYIFRTLENIIGAGRFSGASCDLVSTLVMRMQIAKKLRSSRWR